MIGDGDEGVLELSSNSVTNHERRLVSCDATFHFLE